MVLAAIVINQTGKPAGLPSQSRDDLTLGVPVSLTNNDNTDVVSWSWVFVSRPVGSSAVISGSATPVASFTPDVRGSYLVSLTVDSSPSNPASDTRIAAVKTSYLGIRKPATSEQKEFDAVEGWSAAQQAMIDAIDTDAALSLKRNGSNAPTADIGWAGYRILNLGGLQNEGSMRLGETSNPAAAPDKGFIYAKDDSGDTELFYMDDGGAVVQITKDGQLNVTSLQGDALPSKTADGFLKRNAGNTGWEEVTYGSAANSVCQGNDSRLSDSRPPTGAASGQLGGTFPGPDVRGLRETNGPTLLSIGTILDGQVLVRDGLAIIGSSTAGGSGGKVKVRVDDAADGYLHEKLLTGPGLSFAIGNLGGNETMTIDAYGEAKVSPDDTTFGYLSGKLVAGSNITLTVLNDGYDESLEISTSGGNTLGAAYNQGGSGAGREVVTVPGLPVLITSSGEEALATDGYLGLSEMLSNPSPLANKGLLYAQDDGYGRTGLFYMDQAGKESLVALDGYAGARHRTVAIRTSVSDPTPEPPNGVLFTKLVDGKAELFYMDDSGSASTMTQDGYLAAGVPREDSLDASGGETLLNLTASPRFAAGKASGRDLDVYRNGLLLKWAASPSGNNQWNYNAGAQRVEFGGALGVSDWVVALYRSYA